MAATACHAVRSSGSQSPPFQFPEPPPPALPVWGPGQRPQRPLSIRRRPEKICRRAKKTSCLGGRGAG